MYCEKCGREIKDNANFCPYCGAPVFRESTVQLADYVEEQPYEDSSEKDEQVSFWEKYKTAIITAALVFTLLSGLVTYFTKRNQPVSNNDEPISQEPVVINENNDEMAVPGRLVLCEIRIRNSSNISSNIIGHVYMGDVIPVLETKLEGNYQWNKIGNSSWVADDGNWTVPLDSVEKTNGEDFDTLIGKYEYKNSEYKASYALYFSELGYFVYDGNVNGSKETDVGFYSIDGDQVLLEYRYRLSEKTTLTELSVQEALLIDENGSIIDTHPNISNLKEIKLDKISNKTGFSDYRESNSYKK